MYNRTYWLDHVLNPSNRYTITDNGDGTFTIAPSGTVMQQGTPQDQIRFNNMEIGISDAHLSEQINNMLLRGLKWETDVESGTKTLNNTGVFPENTSRNNPTSVALQTIRNNTNYEVTTEIISKTGVVGDIVITEKLLNGFKMYFTGPGSSVEVKYKVRGGIMA